MASPNIIPLRRGTQLSIGPGVHTNVSDRSIAGVQLCLPFFLCSVPLVHLAHAPNTLVTFTLGLKHCPPFIWNSQCTEQPCLTPRTFFRPFLGCHLFRRLLRTYSTSPKFSYFWFNIFSLVPKFVFIPSMHLHRSVPFLHHCRSGFGLHSCVRRVLS